ncbi:hypothetical protein FJ250_05865 [bacterium]|nr:hypothetical protein [bacterium]
MPKPTPSPRRLAPPICALVLLAVLAGCGGDDPAGPGPGAPYRLVAPLENAVVDVPLVANQPTTINLTLQLPPDIPKVESAVIDVAGTLDHVTVDGIPLWKVIARKAARLFGAADDVGATATIRVGSNPETVCASGILYGPFSVSHGAALVVEPATVAADAATVDIINLGMITICLTVTANIDATLSVDAVAMDIAEGRCASPADFAGTWTGTWSCVNNCGGNEGGDITMVVTQDGTDASYTDQGGDTPVGVICGNMFRFEYGGENYRERGTLTITGPNTAIKRSTWRSRSYPYCGGDCTDYVTRQDFGDCPPLTITSGAPPAGRVGQAYSFTPTTSGGQGQVTRWAIATVAIPGLSTLSGGTLAGTPTASAVGSWEVRVTVYDQCSPTAQTVSQTYTLNITN